MFGSEIGTISQEILSGSWFLWITTNLRNGFWWTESPCNWHTNLSTNMMRNAKICSKKGLITYIWFFISYFFDKCFLVTYFVGLLRVIPDNLEKLVWLNWQSRFVKYSSCVCLISNSTYPFIVSCAASAAAVVFNIIPK